MAIRSTAYISIGLAQVVAGAVNAVSAFIIAYAVGSNDFSSLISCITLNSSVLVLNRGLQATSAEAAYRSELSEAEEKPSSSRKGHLFVLSFIFFELAIWSVIALVFSFAFGLNLSYLIILSALIPPQVLTSLAGGIHQSSEQFVKWHLAVLASTSIRLPVTVIAAIFDAKPYVYLLLLPISPILLLGLSRNALRVSTSVLQNLSFNKILLQGIFMQCALLTFQLPLIGIKKGSLGGASTGGLLLFLMGMAASLGATFGSTRFRRYLDQSESRRHLGSWGIHIGHLIPLFAGFTSYIALGKLGLVDRIPNYSFSVLPSLENFSILISYALWTVCLSLIEERISQVQLRSVVALLLLLVSNTGLYLLFNSDVTVQFTIHAASASICVAIVFLGFSRPRRILDHRVTQTESPHKRSLTSNTPFLINEVQPK